MEDQQIIGLYFARSESAIDETAKKYGAYLNTVVGNILRCPEDTEEIVSDVYLAAWNSMPPTWPNVLKHYLSRIARNLSFRRYAYLTADKRSNYTEVMLSELEECIPDGRSDPAEVVEARALGRCINGFLASLSREDCGLFVSRYFYAQTLEELAKKYGSSPRKIKYHLEKLRFRLRTYLQKEGMSV